MSRNSHRDTPALNAAWLKDISALSEDFDGSLSGLGVDLGSVPYNMGEALMALPDLRDDKQSSQHETSSSPDSNDSMEHESSSISFDYVLIAPTSPAAKITESPLTYLNQGQSYQLKMKCSNLNKSVDVYFRSSIKICFFDRRLQHSENELLEDWKREHPTDRILDIDERLSYGVNMVSKKPGIIHAFEVLWKCSEEPCLFVQVRCISTEFTPRKHGGEKGVPFRLQIDTFVNLDPLRHLHSAHCQVKVFKLKGADRKNKTDREKIERQKLKTKDLFQPPRDFTSLIEVRNECAWDELYSLPPLQSFDAVSKPPDGSPGDGSLSEPEMAPPKIDPPPPVMILPGTATPAQVNLWLHQQRFKQYSTALANFSGSDLLRMSRDDMMQICGIADGIRLYNALRPRPPRPMMTLFLCQDSDIYHAVYLENLTNHDLTARVAQLVNISPSQIAELYLIGPAGIHVIMSDEVVHNLPDSGRFAIDFVKDETGDRFHVLFKAQIE